MGEADEWTSPWRQMETAGGRGASWGWTEAQQPVIPPASLTTSGLPAFQKQAPLPTLLAIKCDPGLPAATLSL